MYTATAISHPNIAFIKYWGNRDSTLRIPANGSISMNLDSLWTQIRVTFDKSLNEDQLTINGEKVEGSPLQRVSAFLNHVRKLSGVRYFALIESTNNFPLGVGLASSASAFAALSLAATAAMGIKLNQRDLSRLARLGSGSACRSIPQGFVEWQAGEDDESSYAFSIASPDHWRLTDCIAILSPKHKAVGSTEGHQLAETSPLQPGRVADAPRRLELCRRAILERDFEALAKVVELDCLLMHAVMMTSDPALFYWQPKTLEIIYAVRSWRASGVPVCYTIDAGPNVHVLCIDEVSNWVATRLREIPEVLEVLISHPGGPTRLIEEMSLHSHQDETMDDFVQ
jgi:diphosphomevalonate decarboxylase